MRRLILAIFIIITIVSLITISFTVNQVRGEEVRMANDLQYRSTLLAESLREAIEPNFINRSEENLELVVERFTTEERLAGLVILDNRARPIVSSSSASMTLEIPPESKKIAEDVMDSDKANGDFVNIDNRKMYVFAIPLRENKRVVGSLMLVQNAGYIDSRLSEIWRNNFIRLFVQSLILSFAILLVIRWLIYAPIKSIADSLKLARLDKTGDGKAMRGNIPDLPFFKPLVREIAVIRKSLTEARLTASEEARLRHEKLDTPWTAERLKEFVKDSIKGQTLIAVSNREPYIHEKKGDKVSYYFPASGMATAIEAIMQACGGEWVAHGSGSGDRSVVDAHDRIGVPPDDPKYTLKRVWLSEKEEKGYYYGFSNEGLWPLCHNVHNRPIFRKDDWVEYQNVNRKFAITILKEIKDLKDPIIFIQDFHFALLPKMIKDKRPDAQIIIFWHIPWPTAEAFSICPFRKELLDGMLGADMIGFHTQLHCNNFIDTISREMESRIDLEKFAVTRNNHISYIKPFPISIAFYNDNDKAGTDDIAIRKKELLKDLNIKSEYIGLGVDRLDYTKGIIERFQAVESFLNKYPQYREKFTFIQIAAPSRSGIKKYDQFGEDVEKEVERINNSLKTRNWKPIIYRNRHHSQAELNLFYLIANVFLVTSLHDGMNLVAKEYIAARNDEKGTLILSKFAGASAELSQAIIVNPYDIEWVADAIKTSLEMSISEQTRRMRKMRKVIKNNNVYRWSAEIIRNIADLE
jgi:alpha,alpha-trehalose-phosphate synthase [UDP-forming]